MALFVEPGAELIVSGCMAEARIVSERGEAIPDLSRVCSHGIPSDMVSLVSQRGFGSAQTAQFANLPASREHDPEGSNIMAQWAYKVAYIDYRGRISSEGKETLIGDERRSAFARRYLNTLGEGGWELVGIQPLTANSAYYVFKRPAQEGDYSDQAAPATAQETPPATPSSSEPTVESV